MLDISALVSLKVSLTNLQLILRLVSVAVRWFLVFIELLRRIMDMTWIHGYIVRIFLRVIHTSMLFVWQFLSTIWSLFAWLLDVVLLGVLLIRLDYTAWLVFILLRCLHLILNRRLMMRLAFRLGWTKPHKSCSRSINKILRIMLHWGHWPKSLSQLRREWRRKYSLPGG